MKPITSKFGMKLSVWSNLTLLKKKVMNKSEIEE